MPESSGYTLLTGGARSGKSAIAVRRAAQHPGPVVFVATGQPRDEEMTARIARHQAERPQDWQTVEAPHELPAAILAQRPAACLVVDCLALWVSNLLERGDAEATVLAHARAAAQACAGRVGPTLVVTNEVGLGLVPMHPVGRAYRDLLGRVNIAMADRADRVELVVAGRTLLLAGASVEDPGDPIESSSS